MAFAVALCVALVLAVAFAMGVTATAGVAASTECGALPISSAQISDASGRLRKECITAKQRAAGVMSVYLDTAKNRISINGINAVRSCLGSPVRVDAADVGSASAPATARVKSGSSVPAMPATDGACVTRRTIYDVLAQLRLAREVFRRKSSAKFGKSGHID
ncbi:hypothetical protein [Xanthomonas vasicola]|uniref:hypothetical protein n=1 Tax=Xanthomonas vasicola TaxID=56459 RepID=UPI001D0C7DB4|nr:hypothetical protein [Xanthomonas vasicola]